VVVSRPPGTRGPSPLTRAVTGPGTAGRRGAPAAGTWRRASGRWCYG